MDVSVDNQLCMAYSRMVGVKQIRSPGNSDRFDGIEHLTPNESLGFGVGHGFASVERYASIPSGINIAYPQCGQ